MLDFMFVVFAGLAVLGGLVVAFAQNIVHSAFALVASLFGVAGLYWTLGADFLGAAQILVYVGGVTVLLLFAVMLSTRDSTRLEGPWRYLLTAVIAGLMGATIWRALEGVGLVVLGEGHVPGQPAPTTGELGRLFLERTQFLLPFEVVSVLLLVVLIGAVAVARRTPEGEESDA